MRRRALILAPLLSCSLVASSLAYAAPAEEAAEGETAEGEAPPVEEIDEEKLEQAKVLYTKAEKLAKKKKWKQAEALYEEAYYLVPGKHGFAHKVGVAADKADDCEKAVEYMVHFLQYAVDEKFEARREEAREVLVSSLEKGCVTEEELNNIHLTPEQIQEKARTIYQEAEELAAAEKWAEAAETYEQAYYLVPERVGFSHKVGMAAYKAEDCDKAHEYLIHFVDYAEPEKYAEKMAEATKIIQELERSGCVSGQEMEQHHLENPFDLDPDSRRDDDETKPKSKDGGKGLLIGGSTLLVAGLAGVGVGVAGFVLAGSSQANLDALASTDTATGLPTGDYACRDVASDQCPPTLEAQIRNRQLMGFVGVGVGAAALVGGIALIAVHATRGKKKPSAQARLDSLSPILLPGGGGGAAARLRF